jgi:hypothetical protein
MSRFALKRVANGLLIALMGTVGAAGCLSYPEKQDFGESVKHMQAMQTARPGMQPAPQDGQRARAVLGAYRNDVASPDEIRNEIVINIGSGGQ